MSMEINMDIEVICSWCGKFLRTKRSFSSDTMSKLRVSHSICDSCRDQLMMEYKKAVSMRNPKRT
jgi:hypothetical protein